MRVGVAILGAAALASACSPAPSPGTSPTSAADAGDFPNPPPAAPAAWTTLDQRQRLVGGVFGGDGSQFLTGAVAWRDGFVVIGYTFKSDQDVTARIWASPNGVDWSAVDDPGARFDDAELSWIASDGRTLMAIGGARPGGGALGPPPIVWTSTDGTNWRRVADSPQPLLEVGVGGLAGGSGGFVVNGRSQDGVTRLLRTADGAEWQAVDAAAFAGGSVNSVVPYRGGWLAVGAVAPTAMPAPGAKPQPARAWWSIDGLRWAPAQVAAGPALSNAYPGSSAVLGQGSSDCGGCVANANLWQADGRTWRLLGPDRLLWPAYASDGSRIVAWDNQGTGAFAWSADGITWNPFGEAARDEGAFGPLIVGRNGLLILLATNTEPTDGGIVYLEAG